MKLELKIAHLGNYDEIKKEWILIKEALNFESKEGVFRFKYREFPIIANWLCFHHVNVVDITDSEVVVFSSNQHRIKINVLTRYPFLLEKNEYIVQERYIVDMIKDFAYNGVLLS